MSIVHLLGTCLLFYFHDSHMRGAGLGGIPYHSQSRDQAFHEQVRDVWALIFFFHFSFFGAQIACAGMVHILMIVWCFNFFVYLLLVMEEWENDGCLGSLSWACYSC